MSLYMKDKDLDKSKYKESKYDQLQNYIKNYMHDDPKKLSEEEIAQLYQEAEKELEERKKEQEEQAKQQNEQEGNVINANKLKEVFDKMVEIDTDPQSKRAQEYYRKLEEMERQIPNKKKGEIIIKTMKRNRTIVDTRIIGQELTEQEKNFEKKFIDHKGVKFPEINPVEMTAISEGKQVKIANYRYPSQTKDRQGIIYYVHGYGDYCARYAYLAKQFAEAGFDFVGMDQKGFGHSEGKRAIIDSEESLLEEQLKYFDLVDQKFGGKGVPRFQLGNSMGALISLKTSINKPKWFNGLGLVAPYIELKNPEQIEKHQGLAKFMGKIFPSYKLSNKTGPQKYIPPKYEAYMKDPLLEIDDIPVHNILITEQSVKKFKESEMDKVKTPFIMILGGQDQQTSNKAAREFFDIAPVNDKDIITYEDATHNILMDGEYMPMAVKDLISWFHTHS